MIKVPKSKITSLLEKFHNGRNRSHLGINKTMGKIKQRFYWVNCGESVVEWILDCEVYGSERYKGEKSGKITGI